MTTQDDLDQLLWDYVFGLLEPAEARALEARITSEHDVARSYAEVRQRADMLAAAARLQTSPIVLAPPNDVAAPTVEKQTAPMAYRAVTWLLTGAAVALVALLGYTWQRHGWLQDPETVARAEEEFATKYRHVVVTGPADVQPTLTNLFTVQLQDLNGNATEDRFEYRLTDPDGQILLQDTAAVNADGIGQVTIDGTLVEKEATLEVACPTSRDENKVQLNLVRAQSTLQTYLACDNGIYRPGDTVFFRAMTSHSLDGEDRDPTLQYKVINPNGETVETNAITSKAGVSLGAIALGDTAPSGHYTLQVESATNEVPLQQVEFDVKSQAAGDWDAYLVLTEDRIVPGQRVVAALKATTNEGAPVADADVDVDVRFNGQPLTADNGRKTDEQGQVELSFRLPEGQEGQADMAVKLAKGEKQVTLSRSLLVQQADKRPAPAARPGTETFAQNGIQLKFYPEGGALLAGISNDVYFEALDAEQNPVSVYGCVVDSKRNKLGEASTTAAGRGTFALTPERHEKYFLEIETEDPDDHEQLAAAPLPDIAKEPTSKLAVKNPLIAAGRPIDLQIATTKATAQLLVAATSGEVVVGQQVVELGKPSGSSEAAVQHLALPVTEDAGGVLQVTLYDLASESLEPVSWGHVYRAPAKYLTLALESNSSSTTNDVAGWTVRVRDEQDRGCVAVLGINVLADDAQPAAAPAGSLATAWYFPQGRTYRDSTTSKNFFAGKNELQPLDFALATGGLSSDKFHDMKALGSTSLSGGAGGGGFGGNGATVETSGGSGKHLGYGFSKPPALTGEYFSDYDGTNVVLGRTPSLRTPAIADNFQHVEASYTKAVTSWRDNQQQRLHMFALTIGTVSLSLLFAIALLLTLRIAGRPFGWLPSLATAAAALVMAGLWLSVQTERPIHVAVQPIVNLDGKPRTIALAGVDGDAIADRPSNAPALEQEYFGNRLFSVPADPIPLVVGEALEDAPAIVGQIVRPDTDDTWAAFDGPGSRGRVPTPDDFDWYWREMIEPEDFYKVVPQGGPDGMALSKLGVADRRAPITFVPLAAPRLDDLAATDEIRDVAKRASSTLYWNPSLETNEQGEAHFRFATPAGVRYRILIDAHGGGRVGSMEHRVDPPPQVHALPAQE